MNKTDLRRAMRQRKREHTAEELNSLSAAAIAHLTRTEAWLSASTILLYYSLPDEVDTHALVNAAAATHTVLLPVVDGDELRLRRYSPTAPLAPGAFDILEPTGEDFTDLAAIDLAVVPGMAFSLDGARLGRGRGFYDRLLPRLTSAYKIGLCWPFQLTDALPTEDHDIRMDAVVC